MGERDREVAQRGLRVVLVGGVFSHERGTPVSVGLALGGAPDIRESECPSVSMGERDKELAQRSTSKQLHSGGDCNHTTLLEERRPLALVFSI